MKRLLPAAIAALIASLSVSDVAHAKSPTITPDRETICALFDLAGEKDCPDYELVRSDRSGDVLIPAILSGSVNSVPVVPGNGDSTGPVVVPVER